MNIGIVTTWFERGAAYVSKQYMQLLQEDNNVFIYARGGEKYAKVDPRWNKPNVTWGKRSFFQINSTPIVKNDFKRWIKRNNIEVILFNEQQWWPPVIWAKELGVKTGSYIDYYTEETVPFYNIFDFLICNTKRHYSVFKNHNQCYYIPWGTDIELFKPAGKNIEDKNKLVFFNSCGMNPDRKGVLPLLKVFSHLHSDKIKLIIHSQVDLIKFFPNNKELIEKLISAEKLEVVNMTLGAPGLYHRGDIYCYLSKLDGIGLTIAEALSCGLHVIVPDNPPMNEFIEDKLNGRVVKIEKLFSRKDGYYWPQCETNGQSLQEVLEYYLNNIDKIGEFKATARKYAIEKLNWHDRKNMIEDAFLKSRHFNLHDKELYKQIKKYELYKKKLIDFIYFPYRNVKSIISK